MEPKTGNIAGNSILPRVVVRKDLHSLIGTVKKMQLVTTYEEVLDGLKIYIWEKKLYDPHNPFRVCCKDDELGSVIGAKEFTVFDVKTFLHKLVFPLSKSSKDSPEVTLHSVSDNSSKRKLDENSDSEQKKKCAAEASSQSSVLENSEQKVTCPVIAPSQFSVLENSEPEQKETCAAAAPSQSSVLENSEPEQKLTCAVGAPSQSFVPGNSEPEYDKMCAGNVPLQSMSPMILHIPPSPLKYDNSSESSNSLQGYETAYVKDSTDEFSSVIESEDFLSPGERILAIEETYSLEYEIESDSSDDVQSSESSLSSSEVDITAQVALDAAILSFVCRTDSDIEFFADDSSDEDIEIPASDHWKCDSCNFFNRPPMRYCSRCWKERLEWLPEKSLSGEFTSPPRNRRKKKKSRTSFMSSSKESTEKDQASFSKSSQESQATSCSSEVSLSQELPQDSQSCSMNEPGSRLCIICCDKPRNASIVHGKYAHQISCYRCARTLQKQKKRCPLCRRTIDRVVYQISDV